MRVTAASNRISAALRCNYLEDATSAHAFHLERVHFLQYQINQPTELTVLIWTFLLKCQNFVL